MIEKKKYVNNIKLFKTKELSYKVLIALLINDIKAETRV